MSRTVNSLITGSISNTLLRRCSRLTLSYLAISATILSILWGCSEHSLSTQATSPTAKEILGEIDGIHVQAPQKYQRSVLIMLPNEGAKAFGIDDLRRRNILGKKIRSISIILRETNHEPILNDSDFRDWVVNELKPYDRVSPNHRWMMLSFGAGRELARDIDVLMANGSDPENKITCDNALRYGLTHCYKSENETIDSIFKINEYFFNAELKNTLLECSHYKKFNVYSCEHFFSSPFSKINFDVRYTSENQIPNWNLTEKEMRLIGNLFLIK